ncbi:unnamed protein product [Lasius platythorax]|uniref:C2H2-type domain-containing protein n=1 Tax=Lasius platythorax TaxID=488582 RepID=A0AAV2NFH9_9HYME
MIEKKWSSTRFKIQTPWNAARLHSNVPSKIINNEGRKETKPLIKEELDQEEGEEEEEEEKENAEEIKEEGENEGQEEEEMEEEKEEEEKKEDKKIYRCNICLYETTYKFNLKTHFQSAKHKKK